MKIFKNIEIYEVSLVNNPADPHCVILAVGFKEKNE